MSFWGGAQERTGHCALLDFIEETIGPGKLTDSATD